MYPQDQKLLISGKLLNQLQANDSFALKLTVTPPLRLTDGPGGKQISIDWREFPAVICDEISSSSSSSSSEGEEGGSSASSSERPTRGLKFKEVEPVTGGLWRIKAGGRRGDGAYEHNRIPTFAGSVVWMRQIGDNEFRFQWPGWVENPTPCLEEEPESSSSSSESSESSSSDSEGGSSASSTSPELCPQDGTRTYLKDIECINGQLVKTYGTDVMVDGVAYGICPPEEVEMG